MNTDLVSICSSPSNRREATRETHHASRAPPPGRLCLRGRPWLSRTHAGRAAIERPPPAAGQTRSHQGHEGSKVRDQARECQLRTLVRSGHECRTAWALTVEPPVVEQWPSSSSARVRVGGASTKEDLVIRRLQAPSFAIVWLASAGVVSSLACEVGYQPPPSYARPMYYAPPPATASPPPGTYGQPAPYYASSPPPQSAPPPPSPAGPCIDPGPQDISARFDQAMRIEAQSETVGCEMTDRADK